MSIRFTLSLAAAVACTVLTATAQNRDLRAEKLVLDDNNGNAITVQTTAGPITGGTLTIPDPAGVGQFLISTPAGGTQSVFGHLLPGTDNLYNLGSATFRWRHLFLSGNVQLGSGLRLTEPGGTDYTEFVAQAQANNITYTLPAVNGTTGQVLRIASSPAPTLTAATLEWAAAAASGWNLTGNAGTTAGTNFVGTTDNVAFEIHVDEAGTATEGRRRVMRFEPNATSANIIGGFSGNSITSGAVGGVIAGGGLNTNTNVVTDDYGVVGGGRNNRAGDNAGTTTDAITATVAGGIGNTASGGGAAIGGGGNNLASGVYATVGGGTINAASSTSATVGGGFQNTASGAHSTIAGGNTNTISGDYSAISGGRGLTFSAAADRSFGFHANNSSGTRNMTIADPDVAVFGNTDLWLANNDNAPSELRFFEAYNTAGAFPNATANFTAFKAASVQGNDITYTLPAAITGTVSDERFLRSTTTTANTASTLDWVDAATIVGGSAVLYNVAATQATATPRTNRLLDIAYSGAAADAAAAGARITSSAGAAGNNNATALTLVATKTGTGVATALDATGNVAMSEGSLLRNGSGGATINPGGGATPVIPYAAQFSNVVTDFADPSGINVQKLTNLTFSPTTNHPIVAQDVNNLEVTIPNGVTIGNGMGGGGFYPHVVLLQDASAASPGGAVERMALSLKSFNVANTSTTSYTLANGSNLSLQLDGGTIAEVNGTQVDINVSNTGTVTNNIAGIRTSVNSSSANTLSAMYGMYVTLSASAPGVATNSEGVSLSVSGDNAVGLRINSVNGYSTSYAIRSDASAQSYFNGSIGIGQATPSEKLEVRNGNILLSNNGTEGELRLEEPAGPGTNYTAFKSQTQSDNITYTLPAANGTAGQVLQVASSPAPTLTAATLEWATSSSSGWGLTGNAGTTAGTNFVGTTDNQAFEIHVDEAGTATEGRRRVMRYEPNATSANIIGGFSGNSITGSTGSVIAGGGSNGATTTNSVATSNYGTIAGGTGNRIVGSTNVMIGAGLHDTISTSNYSFIGGGNANSIVGASASVIPGGSYLKIGSNSFGFNGLSAAAQTDISLTGANFSSVAYFGNAALLIGNVDGASRALRFYEPNSSFSYSGANYTAFKAQAQGNDITYTLPAANGTDGQVLRLATGATATAGTLEWATASGLTLPFSNTTSSASTLFDVTNSGAGQASNFNISGAKTASTTTMVVDNDATNTTTDAINKTVLSVASSGTFTGSGGGSTTATGVEINMTGTGGDVNKGMTIAVAGSDAVGLQMSSGRVQMSVATVTYVAAMNAPNNAAIIRVLDSGGNAGNSTLTLSTTGVVEGQICWVYNSDVNDNVVVQSIPTRTLNSGGTNRDLWQFIYIDGAWRPLR